MTSREDPDSLVDDLVDPPDAADGDEDGEGEEDDSQEDGDHHSHRISWKKAERVQWLSCKQSC